MSRAHPIAGTVDHLLLPVHRWIWSNPARRTQKLLRFSETEIDGGRDILRAAEVTRDPLLRRLYLLHAVDEHRHGILFRRRAADLGQALRTHAERAPRAEGLPSAGHGLDDVEVEQETDDTMLAF